MGRELRRVPANWEHPKDEKGEYIPLFDGTYKDAIAKWNENCRLWEEGKHRYQLDLDFRSDKWNSWADLASPPQPEFYRPDWADAPWFQVYETVTEGTPVTPAFSTRLELFNHLVEEGTDWDKGRPWDYQAADAFVYAENWMPSGIIKGGKVIDQTQEVVK